MSCMRFLTCLSVPQMLTDACGPDVSDLPEWCPKLYEEAGQAMLRSAWDDERLQHYCCRLNCFGY